MADVQQDALDRAAADVRALGAEVLPFRLDVAHAAEVEALGAATKARFGAPSIVFNNAGVGAGGLIWENTAADWACDNAFVAAHNAAVRISTCAKVNGYDVLSLARDALKRIEKLANTTA